MENMPEEWRGWRITVDAKKEKLDSRRMCKEVDEND